MHVINIEPGRDVLCDFCGDDFTDSAQTGGLLFQSRAVCPTCAPKIEADAECYGETELIRGRCPAGVSFADWVRSLR